MVRFGCCFIWNTADHLPSASPVSLCLVCQQWWKCWSECQCCVVSLCILCVLLFLCFRLSRLRNWFDLHGFCDCLMMAFLSCYEFPVWSVLFVLCSRLLGLRNRLAYMASVIAWWWLSLVAMSFLWSLFCCWIWLKMVDVVWPWWWHWWCWW